MTASTRLQPIRHRGATRLLHAGLVAAVTAVIAMPGCYRHVVGVKGTAPTKVEVHEPNVSKAYSFWAQPEARRVNRPPPIAPPAPTSTVKPGS
jgi:hypothetical protein